MPFGHIAVENIVAGRLHGKEHRLDLDVPIEESMLPQSFS
jgi:hypothetical protein